MERVDENFMSLEIFFDCCKVENLLHQIDVILKRINYLEKLILIINTIAIFIENMLR